MKNNLTYEEAVKKLKTIVLVIKTQKYLLKQAKTAEDQRAVQQVLYISRNINNLLLSVIAAHKQARKLYAENRRLQSPSKEHMKHVKAHIEAEKLLKECKREN